MAGKHEGPRTGNGRDDGRKLGRAQLDVKRKDGSSDLRATSATFGSGADAGKAKRGAKEAGKERVYVERAEQRRRGTKYFG
jgi:hypothetical protein